MKFFPVILSGGAGTRLWPISRADKPKQFSPMFAPNLFEQTIARLKPHGDILVVTNKHLKSLTLNSLENQNIKGNIILEPEAKGTAPPALLVALTLAKQGFEESIMGLFPSDHLIEDQKSFEKDLKLAIETANTNNLITFGISPTRPTSEYGYIKHKDADNTRVLDVIEFVEKPPIEKAQKYNFKLSLELRYFYNQNKKSNRAL